MDRYLREHPQANVAAFSFRARAPVFEGEEFDLCLAESDGATQLWVAGVDSDVRMTARIEIASESGG